jgi:hypothetical protein
MNNGVFEVNHVSLHITRRCTLKCKLCAEYVPYCPPDNYSLEFLRSVISELFNTADIVKQFDVAGGEPLLHENLPQIFDYLFEYGDRIGKIVVITNGTIVPSDDLLRRLVNPKCEVLLDNYGPKVSIKFPQIESKLTNNGVKVRVLKYYGDDAYFGGWVNFNDFTKKHETQTEVETVFAKCAFPQKQHWCFGITNGQMNPCAFSRRARELGITPDNPAEYVDLLDKRVSVEKRREIIQGLYNCKSLAACAFCTGLCEDSERFQAGEQI